MSKTFAVLTCATDPLEADAGIAANIGVLFRSGDAILRPAWRWPDKARWAARSGLPCFEFLDFLKADSAADYYTYQWFTHHVATLQNRLTPLVLEGVSLAHALALQVGTAFRHEAALAVALRELERAGYRRLILLANPDEPYQAALVRWAVHTCGWTLGVWLRIEGNSIDTGVIDLNASRALDTVRETLSRNAPKPVRSHRWPRGQRVISPRGRPLRPGGILCVQSSSNPFYARHTLPVAKALLGQGRDVQLLLGKGADAAQFAEILDRVTLIQGGDASELQLEPIIRSLQSVVLHTLAEWAMGTEKLHSWFVIDMLANPGLAYHRLLDLVTHDFLPAEAAFRFGVPEAVWIGTTAMPMDDLVSQQASLLKIPVVHGYATSADDRLRSEPFFRFDHHFAAYGEQVATAAARRGVPPEQIHLVGAPHYDYIYSLPQQQLHDRFLDASGLARGTRVIAVLSSRLDPDLEDRWLLPLLAWAKGRQDVAVLIKPHQVYGVTYDRTRARIEAEDTARPIWGEMTSVDAIAIADLVITDASTVGAETALMRKPLISVNLTGQPYAYNNYVEMGVALPATSPDELVALVERLAAAPDLPMGLPAELAAGRDDFVRRYNFGDGGAADRAARLLTARLPPLPQQVMHGLEYFLRGDGAEEYDFEPIEGVPDAWMTRFQDTARAMGFLDGMARETVQRTLLGFIRDEVQQEGALFQAVYALVEKGMVRHVEENGGAIIIRQEVAAGPGAVAAPGPVATSRPIRERAVGRLGSGGSLPARLLRKLLRRPDLIPADALPPALEAALAEAYWRRYPDIAASPVFGPDSPLGVFGPRTHYNRFGERERRIWGEEIDL